MKVTYARRADVLYLVFEETERRCEYVESDSGVIYRVDPVTERIVGITIPDFSRYVDDNKTLEIPEIMEGLPARQLLQLAGE